MHRGIVQRTFCGVVGLSVSLLAAGSSPAGTSESLPSGSASQVSVHELLQAHEPLINEIEARSFSFAAAPGVGHLDSALLCRDPAAPGIPAGDEIGVAQPASALLAPQAPVSPMGITNSIDQVLGARLARSRNLDTAFVDQPAPPVAVPPPPSVWGGLALMAALAVAGIRKRFEACIVLGILNAKTRARPRRRAFLLRRCVHRLYLRLDAGDGTADKGRG